MAPALELTPPVVDEVGATDEQAVEEESDEPSSKEPLSVVISDGAEDSQSLPHPDVAVGAIAISVIFLTNQSETPKSISYSFFKEQLLEDNVRYVQFEGLDGAEAQPWHDP